MFTHTHTGAHTGSLELKISPCCLPELMFRFVLFFSAVALVRSVRSDCDQIPGRKLHTTWLVRSPGRNNNDAFGWTRSAEDPGGTRNVTEKLIKQRWFPVHHMEVGGTNTQESETG